jgi:hypothetical protein
MTQLGPARVKTSREIPGDAVDVAYGMSVALRLGMEARQAGIALIVTLLAACSGGVVGPAEVDETSDKTCTAAAAPTAVAPVPSDVESHEWESSKPLRIDIEQCQTGRWFTWLPFGSAWVIVQSDGDTCKMWLGGETENPAYDGSAAQFCQFPRQGCETSVEIKAGDGGPAHLDNPACTR